MSLEPSVLIKGPIHGQPPWLTVSRVAILNRISEVIRNGDSRCIYLSGPPGIGKTDLGFMYAHRDEVARWSRVSKTSIRDLFSKPWNVKADELYVHVMDGLDEYEHPNTLLHEIGLYLIENANARIIFTARNGLKLPDVLSPLTYEFPIGPFSREETRLFLGQLNIPELTIPRIDLLHDQLEGIPALLARLVEIFHFDKEEGEQLLNYLNLNYWPGLTDANGVPLHKGSDTERRVVKLVGTINEQLLSRLAASPSLVHELSPRTFEELVAELLRHQGYEVSLTPATRDGGKDIYAITKSNLGTFLYVVECKKYAPEQHVGVALVRNLYGVVQAERASAGILVTTSSFTKGAIEWHQPLRYQLSLRDYAVLKEWLASIRIK